MKIYIIVLTVIKLHLTVCALKLENPFVSKISELTLSNDGKRNFTQLTAKYGHNAEEHNVITEDGYVLTIFHIPGDKSAVLLTHGLANSGDGWVIRGPGSLGIALADAGYDVWITNNRGNLYGRRHVRLNPDTDKEFWNFSFHEMGIYDLAAVIDYVRDQTGEEKIFTIGHSQGTTQEFVLLSQRPEYNERVKLFIALAPAVYFYNMPPVFQLLADAGPIIVGVLEAIGQEELLKDRGALTDLIRTVCSKGIVSYAVCAEGVVFPVLGFNPENFEPEFLPTFFGHAPCGISRKCLAHFDQVYLRKKYSQYDYGVIGNLNMYGTTNPPDYDLDKVSTNVALLSGDLDTISLVENGKLLQKNLQNADFEIINSTTHLDFVFGKQASKYLFPSIFKLLKKYDI